MNAKTVYIRFDCGDSKQSVAPIKNLPEVTLKKVPWNSASGYSFNFGQKSFYLGFLLYFIFGQISQEKFLLIAGWQ
jgi:hypothetical protein